MLLRHSLDTLEERHLPFSFNCSVFLWKWTSWLSHHLVLHPVPDYVCVVAAVLTWTGDVPSLVHKQIPHTFSRLEASEIFSLQHLQVEGLVPAVGQRKKDGARPHENGTYYFCLLFFIDLRFNNSCLISSKLNSNNGEKNPAFTLCTVQNVVFSQ